MKKLTLFMLVTMALGLTGCASQIPLPSIYESSYQPKMLAAHHWNLLAGDVATRLETALADVGSSGTKVLFVDRPSKGTVFNASFHELLETQLMQQGFGVTRSPENADLIIEYGAQYAGDADINVDTGYTEVDAVDDDIIITVAVLNGNRYVTRISEIFYVDQTSHGEYIAAKPPVRGRLIEVVSP